MVLTVVSIYDRVSETFGRLFFSVSAGSAIRSFSDEIKNESPDNMLFKHPKDFELYSLGTFNDSDGKFTLSETPKLLTSGVYFVPEPTE